MPIILAIGLSPFFEIKHVKVLKFFREWYENDLHMTEVTIKREWPSTRKTFRRKWYVTRMTFKRNDILQKWHLNENCILQNDI